MSDNEERHVIGGEFAEVPEVDDEERERVQAEMLAEAQPVEADDAEPVESDHAHPVEEE
jgi:hypothetical protein